MDLRDLGNALIYLGSIAGALMAIGGVAWVVVVRPLRKWITQEISVRIQQPLATAAAAAADVQAEMLPNDGESLRDAVNRTEAKINVLSARFTDHLAGHP